MFLLLISSILYKMTSITTKLDYCFKAITRCVMLATSQSFYKKTVRIPTRLANYLRRSVNFLSSITKAGVYEYLDSRASEHRAVFGSWLAKFKASLTRLESSPKKKIKYWSYDFEAM